MIKNLARDWIPPIIFRLLHRIIFPDSSISFQNFFDRWEDAQAASSGYDAKDILQKVKASTLKVKYGEAAYERDSVIFDKIQYSWPILAGLMSVAARNRGKLDVLDFGGSLGSSYFQNRKFLDSLTEVYWSIVEQPNFVACGHEYIEDTCLKFYSSIKECLAERKPNIILLSSVLQYLESPHSLLLDLTNVGAEYLIIDRTPFLESETDLIVVQHVPAEIYTASYPSWLFSKSLIQNYLSQNWDLLTEFECPEGLVKSSDGIEFTFSGFIFKAKQ
jgi:putative methyltransferase (TIGR04325 family)